MTSFRYPVAIRRRAPGTWNGPNWVPGALTPDSIMATVQPAQLSDYDRLDPLPEGRRVEALVRVYTDAQLKQAGKPGDGNGDLVDWPAGMHARPYEVIACSPWQSGIIPHYRYLAALITEPRGGAV